MSEKRIRLPEAVFPLVLYTAFYVTGIFVDLNAMYRYLDYLLPVFLIRGMFSAAYVVLLVTLFMKSRKGISFALGGISALYIIFFLQQLRNQHGYVTISLLLELSGLLPFVLLIIIAVRKPGNRFRKVWLFPGMIEIILCAGQFLMEARRYDMGSMAMYGMANLRYFIMEIWKVTAVFLIGKWLLADPSHSIHTERIRG